MLESLFAELRRFGTLLLGTTAKADEVIINCIVDLLSGPELTMQITRQFIYQRFIDAVPDHHIAFQLPHLNTKLADGQERLAGLVFLLIYVEEFSASETSQILRLDEEYIQSLQHKVINLLGE